MIKLLFSRNKKIGSRLISRFTRFLSPFKETPSHTAILVNNKWVIESTLESGFRVIGYRKWLQLNEIVYSSTTNLSWDFVKKRTKKLKGKKYDYFGVIYLGWRVLLLKYLNISKPKKNLFDHKDKYFCTEVVGNLMDINCQMITPIELLNKIILRCSSLEQVQEKGEQDVE